MLITYITIWSNLASYLLFFYHTMESASSETWVLSNTMPKDLGISWLDSESFIDLTQNSFISVLRWCDDFTIRLRSEFRTETYFFSESVFHIHKIYLKKDTETETVENSEVLLYLEQNGAYRFYHKWKFNKEREEEKKGGLYVQLLEHTRNKNT